jgi:PAS domain S-box-containing protein
MGTGLCVLARRLGGIIAAIVLAMGASMAGATLVSTTHDDYYIRSWQVEDGLPENSATSMVTTADGYHWFGTFDGLVRFDGVQFQVLNPETTPALPASGVVHLHLDRSERLWVGTVQGLAMREGEVWRAFGPADGWEGDVVRSVAEAPDGRLLFTTFDGHVLSFGNGRFEPVPLRPRLERGPVAACDATGRWWIVQPGFFGVWNGAEWIEVEGAREGEAASAVCAPARDGGIWVVYRRALVKYRSPTEFERRELGVDMRGMWSAFEDSAGNVWACTHDHGLFRIAPDGTMSHWTTENGLTYNGVRFVSEDREGNIWVGTSGGGLLRLTSRRCHTIGVEGGIAEPIVNSVSSDGEGGVLVGTYGHGPFQLKDGVASAIRLGRIGGYVQSMLSDRTGRVWIGSFGDGLFVKDASGVRQVSGELTGGANVLAIFEDTKGRIWVSGGQAIAAFEGEAWREYGEAQGLPRSEVCAFAEDEEGRLWLSNLVGVYRLEGDSFVEVRDENGNALSGVGCLTAETGGTMWMGSRHKGLRRWRAGRIADLAEQLESVGGSVLGILKDDVGNWWLSTRLGLARASFRQLDAVADGKETHVDVLRLGLMDGMATVECSGGRQPVSAKDTRGRLWFATRKGVTMVDPSTFRRNEVPPPVRIEAVNYTSASGETSFSLRQAFASADDALPIPPGSKGIEILYAALSFTDPATVRFKVKMSGVDHDWVDAGNRRAIAYGRLDPGLHVFRVRAANNDGVWSTEEASLTLDVQPFVWQTAWFQVGAATLLVSGGAASAWWIARLRQRGRRRAGNRFRLALEASASGMVMLDGEGRIVLLNAQAERSFGYARDELVGRSIRLLLPEKFAAVHAAIRHVCLSGQAMDATTIGGEPLGRRRDGVEFPIEIGLNPIDAEAGRLVLASISDISARKRAELESARQRNEVAHLSRVNLLGELSGSIAHELNQPLTAILSNAQAAQRFMQRDDVDLGEVREILDDIVEQNKRAGEVIHRLRTLLRKGEVNHEALSVDEVVNEVLKLARSDLINHGVSVEAQLEAGLPRVLGDRIQLQQVLLNLVMNACDCLDRMPSGERRLVVRTARQDPNRVRVTVRDSGSGIPAGFAERIFEPFFTTKGTGMGLGLAVCRTIVTSHACEIWATNNDDVGASFHFTIPTFDGAEA